MRHMLSLSALVLALLGAVCGAAAAEKRLALVIGNSAYVHAAPLANPLNDARTMTAALKATGFEVIEAIDADKLRLDGALRSFAAKLAGADVALFFYAGHGLQLGMQNYLVPVDAKLASERDLEFEAVRLDFVMRQMEIDREGKTSIVILDACRDNPLARNLARSMGTRSVGIGRGLAAASTGLGTFIAYATQPGNVALDGDGTNSPFTAALAKHMRVKNRNLAATMIEVRKDVVAATGGKQVPWDHSALTAEFYFLPPTDAPAAGSVATAPRGTSNDLAALHRRLAELESDVKQRQQEVSNAGKPPPGSMITADGIRLAELRARAATMEDQVKDMQKRLMNARMQEGRAANQDERMRLMRESSTLQMDWTRRGMELKKVREEIAALEAGAAGRAEGPAAAGTRVATLPPVTPKPDPNASAASFEAADNVRLEGTLIATEKAPNPDACRNRCAADAACVGYQHGRKSDVMGRCELFSAVTSRHEDDKWRSGVRKAGGAAGAAPDDLPATPTQSKQGFDFYDGFTVFGTVIKSADAESADGCMVVCRNTGSCTAASFSRLSEQSKPMCVVFGKVTTTRSHQLQGQSVAILRR